MNQFKFGKPYHNHIITIDLETFSISDGSQIATIHMLIRERMRQKEEAIARESNRIYQEQLLRQLENLKKYDNLF